MRRFLMMVAAAAALLAWTAGPAMAEGGQYRDRRGRVFTADGSGQVRVNVIFRQAPGAAEQALMGRARARMRHRFEKLPLAGLEVAPEALQETIDALESDPAVLRVDPAVRMQLLAQTLPWGVDRVRAPAVHLTGNKGAGVKVAVLDTGVKYDHADLAANYAGGYDFVNSDSNPMDDHGHGTHVAGTIAAVDNSIGVIGVAPEVDLYALKVIDSDGYGYDDDFAAALDWSLSHGIQVANYSAGGPAGSPTLELACQEAYDAGLAVVVAAGNEAAKGNPVMYPAFYDTVLAVGATDLSDQRVYFSNWGDYLDVMAPGVAILSTTISGGYSDAWSGTSMACPHVAGVAALVIAGGSTGAAEVFARLRETATDLGAAGWDIYNGWGLVDAAAAAGTSDFISSPAGGDTIPSGSSFAIQWALPAGTVSSDLHYSLDGGSSWNTIAEGWTGGGYYDWTVPKPAGNRKHCLVKVLTRDGSDRITGLDTTPEFIVEVVRTTSPLWRQALPAGTPFTLTWEVNGTRDLVGAVKVLFSKTDGTYWKLLATLPGDARSLAWTVPGLKRTRNRCRVKVVLRGYDDALLGRDSSPRFTIEPAP